MDPRPESSIDRRRLFQAALAAGVGAAVCPQVASASVDDPAPKWEFSLNTSTIRGQKLSVPEQYRVAAEAGYTHIEPWLRDLDQYLEGGGSLADLKKLSDDLGLKVVSVIAFPQWIVDDTSKRQAALEDARRAMDVTRQLGGELIAAPPAGGTNESLDLFAVADHYAALLEVGRQQGVVPQLEVWGFSKTLSRLGEAVLVAVESNHPDACVLPDVYHVYKGGSQPDGLRLLNGTSIHLYHLNDFPADPPRETITDAHRVYPGDGVGPVVETLRLLAQIGSPAILSLELFNPEYWKQDALHVARTGLAKMQASVAAAAKADENR